MQSSVRCTGLDRNPREATQTSHVLDEGLDSNPCRCPNVSTMPENTGGQAIRSRIDAFLAELSGFVRASAMEAVQEVLGQGAPGRRGPGRPRGSGRRGPGRPRKSGRRRVGRPPLARAGKRVRRSAADLEKIAARVLAHVRSNAGHRLEQIGKALKTETAILKRPIANLLAAKKLRTKGQKRGTRYFAGGRGGARKTRRKAKVRRPAKRARKAKARARRPGRQAQKVSKKGSAKAQRSASRAFDASAMMEQAERVAAS
jgi:hypothetical protein